MTTTWARALCRALICLALWNAAPPAHAGLIATSEAAQPERTALLGLLARADVARELQALGIDAAAAKARVAALSDDEVSSLADRINAAPAGADAAGILLLVVVVALIWWAWKR